MRRIASVVAGLAALFLGTAEAAPQCSGGGVEQAHQHVLKCYQVGSVGYQTYGNQTPAGWHPHTESVDPQHEEDCTDSMLRANGYVEDPLHSGHWTYRPPPTSTPHR